MAGNTSISSDMLQALFLNEEVYFIANEFKEHSKNIVLENQEIKAKSAKIVTENTSQKNVVSEAQKEVPLVILVAGLTDINTTFLDKILNALQLSIGKVAIWDQKNTQNLSFRDFTKNLKFSKLLSFGLPLSLIGIHNQIEPYQKHLKEGLTYLFADNLDIIEADVAKKRMLWTSIQELMKV